METGPGNVKIAPGNRLVIRCSKKFTALGLDSNRELKAILGPRAQEDRVLNRIVPPGIVWLKMQTPKTAHWSYEQVDRHSGETPDLTPVEIPIDAPPLDYHTEMRRIVRDELSKHAQSQQKETFAEADDFEMDDEDPISPYELHEMQEDAEFTPPPPKENRVETPKPEGSQDSLPAGSPPPAENPTELSPSLRDNTPVIQK